MKKTLQLIAVLILFALCAGSVHANTLYWDRNGTIPGASSTASGNWSTTSGQFTTASSGSGVSIISWSTLGSADTAYFSAGTDAVNAFNVSVSGTISVGGITFGYGGPVSIVAGTAGIVSMDSAAFSIVNTVNGEIDTPLAGTGALTKSGSGTLTLTSTSSTYSGSLTIAAGTLKVDTLNNKATNGELGNSTGANGVVTLGSSGSVIGTLNVTGAAQTTDRDFAMATGGGGIIDAGANNITINGRFTGSGSLTKNGAGTLFLSTTNSTLTGGTSISVGVVQAPTAGSFGGSTVTVGSSGTLNVQYSTANKGWTNSALTYSAGTSVQTVDFLANAPSATVAPIQVLNAATFTGVPQFNILGSALTDGTYRLIKYGSIVSWPGNTAATTMPGTMVGTISNNAGSLTLWLIATTPASSLHWATGNGTWEVGGSTPWNTSPAVSYSDGVPVEFSDTDATGDPTITLSTTVQPLSIIVSNTTAVHAYTITGSGAIAGTTSLVKTNSGSLTLDVANTYTGGTKLGQGTLNIKNAAALGGVTSTFTINGGTIDNTSGSALTTTAYPQNWNGDFTFTGSSDLNLGAGTVAMNASRTVTASASQLTVGGIISGSTFGLTKAGSGTLAVTGANTYNGDTRIGAGVLVVGNSSALQNSELDMNLADSGTLAFSSGLGTASFANLKGVGLAQARTISLQDVNGTAVALTVGSDNASTTFNGSLSGAGSLIKTGSGTLRVESVGNTWTHSGGTTVNTGGVLQLVNSITLGTMGAGTGGLTVNGNGIVYNESREITMNALSGTGTLTSSSTFDKQYWVVGSGNDSSTWSGSIQKGPAKNNRLYKVGTGTLTITALQNTGAQNDNGDGVVIKAGRIVGSHAQACGSLKCAVGYDGTPAALEMHSTSDLTWDGTMTMTLSNNASLLSSGGAKIHYQRTTQNFPSIDQASGSTVTISPLASGDILELGNGVFDGSATSVITKDGAGTLRLQGSSTYVGKWQINNGTLQLDNIQTLGNAAGHVVTMSGGTLETRNGASATYTGIPNLTVNGDAAISINPTNGVAGLSHTLGTLSIGANTLTVSAGANVTSGTGTAVFGVTTLTGNAIFTVNNGASANTALSLRDVGQLGGTYGLTKNGTGQLNLNFTNSYSGDTTISGGVLNIDADGSIGDGTGTVHLSGGTLCITASRTASTYPVANPIDVTADSAITTSSTSSSASVNFTSSSIGGSAGTLTFRNDSGGATAVFVPRITSGGFTFPRPVVLDNGSGGSKTELNLYNTVAAGDQTFSGLISGNGSIRRTASTASTAGKTVFTAANTFSGGLTQAAGELGIGIDSTGANPPTDGALGTGTLTVTPTGSTAAISASGGAHTLGNAISITTGTFIITGSQDLTLAGNADLGGAGVRTIEVDNTGASTMSGNITSSGGSLTKTGTGTLLISGANTYSGNTVVTTGTLKISGGSAIPNGAGKGDVTVTDTLDLNGTSETINGLNGVGTVNGSSGTPLLTIGDNNASGTWSGNVADAGGVVTLTKIGTGTETISTSQGFSGPLSINGGTVNFAALNNLGSGTAINFANGTLQYAAANTADISGRTVTIGAGGATIDTGVNSVAFSSAIGNSGAGGLTKAGAGVLTLTAANAFSGAMSMNGGTVNFSALNNFGTGTAINFGGGTLQYASGNTTDISVDTVTINAGGGTIDTGGNDVTFASAVGNSGTGGLTKTGAGKLTLSAANTYTGNTTVSAGTVALNGSVAGSATVGAAGTLQGTGTVTGSLTVDGTVSPGNSPGTLSAASATFDSAGNYRWEISSTNVAGTDYDLLAVSGAITVAATSGTPFTNKLVAVGLTDFNNDFTNVFTIASAGSVSGFSADKFYIDTTNTAGGANDWFTNDLAGGSFSNEVSGTSLNVVFYPNHAPVAQATNYTRYKGASLKIPLPDLVATRASDSDFGQSAFFHHLQNSGGTVNQSENGYTVTTNASGSYILYTNTDGTSDTIQYVVSDTAPYRIGTDDTKRYATNTITIDVAQSTGVVTIEQDGGGVISLSFYGIPGNDYVVQRSCGDLVSWADLSGTITAPASGSDIGLIQYTDTPGACDPAYYRIRSQ